MLKNIGKQILYSSLNKTPFTEITEKEIEGKENEAANKLKGKVEELKKVVESIDESIKGLYIMHF